MTNRSRVERTRLGKRVHNGRVRSSRALRRWLGGLAAKVQAVPDAVSQRVDVGLVAGPVGKLLMVCSTCKPLVLAHAVQHCVDGLAAPSR